MLKSRSLIAIPVLITVIICTSFKESVAIYQTVDGKIAFSSEAPMELIKASSDQLVGLIDIDERIYSFKIKVRSFKGFNSPLQKEHFNENYMESDKFPEASFKGKIIEDIDLTVQGTYELRAKGILTIHGVAQERIIKSNVIVNSGKMTVRSNFSVLLSDHNIPIPKVVYQKLANEIKVEVNSTLEPR